MYVASVLLLLFLLPMASTTIDTAHTHAAVLPTFGRWMVFYAAGIRLSIAGLRQAFQPRFTAEEIFTITDTKVFPIVRELGFANLSMSVLAILTLWHRDWLTPAALVGGLYYGLAAVLHIARRQRNAKENIALYTDVWASAVLLTFTASSLHAS